MVQSVQRAMTILMMLSDAYGNAVSLEQLSKTTHLNKSTCIRILSTLEKDCFVQHVSSREGYKLGPFIYYLTRNSKYRQRLIELSHPVLQWLNRALGQTVLLTVLYEDHKFIIHRIEGGKKLGSQKSDMILGNLMGTASGRVLIANMPQRDRTAFFQKYGLPSPEIWPGADSLEAVEHMLETYRRQGYAIVRIRRSERVTELAYACEVHSAEKCVGAIAVAVADESDDAHISLETHRNILRKMLIASREINRRIAFDLRDV